MTAGLGTVYGFPYAGLSEDRQAYKQANFTPWENYVYREKTENEKIYETAQRWSGLVPSQPQDLLPSTMQWREFFGPHDALTSSVLASAGYATAHFAGASEENKRAIAQTIANIAAIGGTLQAGKTGLLPVTGSLGVPNKPGAIEESPQTNALVVPPSSQNNPKNQQNAKPPTVAEVGIPASSSVARDKLHEHLAEQAGIPRDLVDKPYSIWGKTIDQIRQSFTMDGALVTAVPPRASSSGNAQVYEVEGSASGVGKFSAVRLLADLNIRASIIKFTIMMVRR